MYTRSKYNLKIDLQRSYGSYLIDDTGRKYLDFFNQYSTNPLGYNHPIFDVEFYNKLDAIGPNKIANCELRTDIGEEFYKEFTKYPGKDYKNFYFCCTGGLAVESALKLALDRKDYGDIISFYGNFHGITGLGMFVTSPFSPIDTHLIQIEGDEFLPFTPINYDNLQDTLSDIRNVNSVIVEPIQSTYGDRYIDKEYLKILREFCDDKEALLIFDEVQTGFGATGKMWYYEHLGIKPDIVIFGKKSQVSGIMTNEEIDYDKQEVTWDGNLVDMLRCTYIMKAMKNYNLLDNINKASNELDMVIPRDEVNNWRHLGGLGAFDLDTIEDRDIMVDKMFRSGILCNSTRDTTIRLRLNLATSRNDIIDFSKRMDIVRETN